MLEANFKQKLIAELKERFPKCDIVFLSPENYQGIPDLAIFWKDKWAMLEGKREEDAPIRPNQRYWVDHFNEMSFCSFIYPENKEEVLNALERAFKS